MKSFTNLVIAALFLLVPVWPLYAQQPAISPAPTPPAVDSTRQVRSAADTIPATTRSNGRKVATTPFIMNDAATTLDTPDTVRVSAKTEAEIHKIIPKQATLRSLMLPGLGQAYNRQYYKIPFIYVGFGVMGYLFVKYRKLSRDAAEGYRRLLFGDLVSGEQYVNLPPGTVPDILTQPVFIPAQYQKVESVTIGVDPFSDKANVFTRKESAKNVYDTFRRYRDLNILLSGVLWAINIVEANVAAHLRTFDLSDDISMQVEPNVLTLPGTGFVPGVRVAFTFK